MALHAQTITQTAITNVEVTTDATDKPTSWVISPNRLEVTLNGFTPSTTIRVYNQVYNAAGNQFAGRPQDIVLDASGNGSAIINFFFFGGGKITSDQNVTCISKFDISGTPYNATQNFTATLATLGTKVNENKLSASYFSANKNAIIIGDKVAGDYTIYNITGKTVQQGAVSNEINLESLSSGVYILSTEAGVLKIVK